MGLELFRRHGERRAQALADYFHFARRHDLFLTYVIINPQVDRSKAWGDQAGEDLVIVVVNLDPHGTRETMAHLDLPALGMDWNDSFAVHDELTGQTWQWGAHDYVRLDPFVEPAHVLTVRSPR